METQVVTTENGNARRLRLAGEICWFLLLSALVLFFLCAPIQPAGPRKAREDALHRNLQALRHAIERFDADTGRYPVVLTELLAPDAHHLRAPAAAGRSYQGPYFSAPGGLNDSGLPIIPLRRLRRRSCRSRCWLTVIGTITRNQAGCIAPWQEGH